jgi:hypothetical protein
MKKLSIGDVTISSIIERDGPWRTPQEMFPACDPIIGKRHVAELDSEVFDQASGKMVITYQTYIARTPRHTVLIDTCTGEDKDYPPPMDFPKQPWLDGFAAAGLRFEDIVPPPDAPSAPVGSRSLSRRMFRPNSLAAPASPLAG